MLSITMVTPHLLWALRTYKSTRGNQFELGKTSDSKTITVGNVKMYKMHAVPIFVN